MNGVTGASVHDESGRMSVHLRSDEDRAEIAIHFVPGVFTSLLAILQKSPHGTHAYAMIAGSLLEVKIAAHTPVLQSRLCRNLGSG